MAHDPMKIHALVKLSCSGSHSGHASNTFNFRFNGSLAPTLTDWQNLEAALVYLYSHSGTAGHTISGFLGTQINRASAANEIALYQVDVSNPHNYLGSPVHVVPFAVGPGAAGTTWPNDTAVCVSIRGGYGTDPEHSGSTRPRASDRGRFFLGPLNSTAGDSTFAPDGTSFMVVSAAMITHISQLLPLFFTQLTTANWVWCVWSRKEQLFKDVQYWCVNNDLDTVRKREATNVLNSWTAF
jgi:hypothetical protein